MDPKDVYEIPYRSWLGYWNFYKEDTCYSIRRGVVNGYCDADFYKSEGTIVYEITDLGKEDVQTITIEKYIVPECSCGFKLGEYLEDGYVEIFKNPYEEITDTKYDYLKRCPNCGQLLNWKYPNENEED